MVIAITLAIFALVIGFAGKIAKDSTAEWCGAVISVLSAGIFLIVGFDNIWLAVSMIFFAVCFSSSLILKD